MLIFFSSRKRSCCILSSQENKSLPLHCRSNHLFPQSFHLFLLDMIHTKYTQKLCLFHIYGDIYAPLITFMGTWISSEFIIFISNSDSNSTKSKCRPNIYSLFFCIKVRRTSYSLWSTLLEGGYFVHLVMSIILSLFWRTIDLIFISWNKCT